MLTCKDITVGVVKFDVDNFPLRLEVSISSLVDLPSSLQKTKLCTANQKKCNGRYVVFTLTVF